MRKIFISFIAAFGVIAWIYIAIVAFNAPECKHVFVEVEEPTIKIEQPAFTLDGQSYQEYSWPIGKQEGKELICVKCFHKQKQMLDYGQPAKPSTYWPPIGGTNCCDSINTFVSGPVFLIKAVDTIGAVRLK